MVALSRGMMTAACSSVSASRGVLLVLWLGGLDAVRFWHPARRYGIVVSMEERGGV